MSPYLLPLASIEGGGSYRICRIRTGMHCHDQRLRELGLLEGRTVRVVSTRDPMICQVGDGRFGLCRRLAQCVLVEPLAVLNARTA